MKKIYLLILKAFSRPFIVTFFIVMFVLLILFLFKYIDDFIGKGLGASVILELFLYASAGQVSMALPLAILLSSIMTFGGLGENYELVAIKSAGISLQRAMMPLVIVVCMLSAGAFLFSDYMLPVINLKYQSLLYDVRAHKAAFSIKEGVFNNSMPGYSIRVAKKDSDGQSLRHVMIYDHGQNNENNTVLIAKEGKMIKTPNNYLILQLKDGIRYEESKKDGESNNPRQCLSRFRFKTTEQKFDLSIFKLQRTDQNLFKAHGMMLNFKQLSYCRDSVQHQIDSNIHSIYGTLIPYYTYNTDKEGRQESKFKASDTSKGILYFLPQKKHIQIIQQAKDQIHSIKAILDVKETFNKELGNTVRGFMAELHKKFTLSFSCLVLFFIGAPLGAIIRKGGLGMPVVAGISCFLVYHIISTIGEKSVLDGGMTPFLGMWIAMFVLSPIAAFITYKATTDSVLFDIDTYKWLFKKYILRKR